MSSNDKKNELTDIRSLPALDDDNEETFESLDDMANNLGLGTEEVEDEIPPALPESPPDFNFESSESSFESDEADEVESFEENDFDSDGFGDDISDDPIPELSALDDSLEDSEFDNSNFDSNEIDNNEFNPDGIDADSFEPDELSLSDETDSFSDGIEESDSEVNFEEDIEEDNSFSTPLESIDENSFESSGEDEGKDSLGEADPFSENESAPTFSPTDIETDFAGSNNTQTQLTDNESSSYTPTTSLLSTEELSSTNLTDSNNDIQKNEVIRESATHNTPPEEFEDFKNFANNMVMENFSSEGNPPFSIILKSIKYHEDIQDITSVLLQHKIIPDEEKENTISALTRGQYLIPRLSEYAAIYLCHQLRRFDLEILMGLTEEISPPKNYQSNDRGPTSKRTLISNRRHDFKFDGSQINNEVITTTLSNFNDFQIRKYIGIITESKNISPDQLSNSKNLEHEISNQSQTNMGHDLQGIRLERENLLASKSEYNYDAQTLHNSDKTNKNQIGLEHIYSELVTNLKTQAKQSNANAIVGINFAITPVSIEDFLSTGPQYQILCTGNMVWIEKN